MFTKKQLAEEAYRELNKRREVYPRLVRDRKLKQVDADRLIDMQEAIYRLIVGLDDRDVALQA